MNITHSSDDAATDRVVAFATNLYNGEVTCVSHAAHPTDEAHSITTILVSQIHSATVHVFITWRYEDDGNIEEVSHDHNVAP
jgi:hypothetical protein